MFERARRLSTYFATVLVIASVGECGGVWANQELKSGGQHWSVVSTPAVGPETARFISCASLETCPPTQSGLLGGPGTRGSTFTLPSPTAPRCGDSPWSLRGLSRRGGPPGLYKLLTTTAYMLSIPTALASGSFP
jgi:hypothetical protein